MSAASDESINGIPPNIRSAFNETYDMLLPQKYKSKYEFTYKMSNKILKNQWFLFFFPWLIGDLHPSFRKLHTPEDFALSIYAYMNGSDRNVTEECFLSLNRYVDSLLSEELWALRMFDSASKLPVGILPGEELNLGNFDQCLSSSSSDVGKDNIYGKYCFGDLEVRNELEGTNITHRNVSNIYAEIASCLPNACSANDISELYSALGLIYSISENDCQSNNFQLKLDLLGTAGLMLLGIVLKLMVIATVYDIYCCYRKIEQPRQLLLVFSIRTNFNKLLDTSNSHDQITCFHGIRVFTVMMIILIHSQAALEVLNFHSIAKLEQFELAHMFVLALRTGVDTFLLISGFLVSYGFMIASARRIKFSIINHWFHRYIRYVCVCDLVGQETKNHVYDIVSPVCVVLIFILTPPLAAIILVSTSLVKYLGSGPAWFKLLRRDLETPCKEYWWSSLLYVQNYVNPSKLCISPTWYLSVDTQLYFLSPILLLLFHKFPYIKVTVLGILIVGLTLFPLYMAWTEHLHIFTQINPAKFQNFFTWIYYPTHVRAPSWLIGFATGYLVYATKQVKLKAPIKRLPYKLVITGWAVMLAIWSFCLFGVLYIVRYVGYNRAFDSLFLAFSGPLWAVAVGCLIFACVHGYAGPVNWMLSNQLMQVLSKLSYSMYLLHNVVLYYDAYKRRTVPVFEGFDFAYTFWSHYMVSLFLAVFWVLAFEYPMLSVQQALWPRKGKN